MTSKNAQRDKPAARAAEIEAAVRSRAIEGFGVLALPTGSGVLCKVVGSNEKAHVAILARLNDRLRDELPNGPTIATTSANSAFVSAKRGSCGAVYAGGGDLADLVGALERDGLQFRFLPVMIRPGDVSAEDEAIRERERSEAEREQDLRREREDRERLNALRENDRENQRRRQQEALRSQYGAMARAFEGALAEEMKNFLQGYLSDVPLRYPEWTAFYAKLKEDRWEFMEVKTTTLDYGTAEFKGRPLETAFAESRIRLRNRDLGAYKDLCIVTGYMDDTEFGMKREPIGVPCEDSAQALASYKQGRRFRSRWIVE